MRQISITLLTLFCVFFIMAPLVGAITSRRRTRGPNVADPGPKQLQRAQRKLSTVTACSTVASTTRVERSTDSRLCKGGNEDVEATAAQLELGECPICIGPLVPEPALINGRNIRRALNELSTATRRYRHAKRISISVRRKLSFMSEQVPDGDINELEEVTDDILTLNTCGHAFHSRCLASWFLMDRFDCPMCRVAYYTPLSPPPQAFVVTSMYVGYRGGRVMGLG